MSPLTAPHSQALATLLYVLIYRVNDTLPAIFERVQPRARLREASQLYHVLGHAHVLLGAMTLALADTESPAPTQHLLVRLDSIERLTNRLLHEVPRADAVETLTRDVLAILEARLRQNLTTIADARAALVEGSKPEVAG